MPRHNDEVPDDAEDRETYDEEEDDPEDDDEEEEDEEDDNPRPTKRAVNPYLDDIALVDDDEDEYEDEDELGKEDGFIEEDNEEPGVTGARGHVELDRRRQNVEDMDAEAMASRLKERYGRRSNRAPVFKGDTNDIPQRFLMPGVNDPSMWMMKCKPGKERDIILALMKRFFDRQYTDAPLDVFSVFARDSLKGYIYIEATKPAHVEAALQNIPYIFHSTLTLVPIPEMPDTLNSARKELELVPGGWVRMKRGKYAGDLAQILEISDSQDTVHVKLIPRIDLNTKEDTFESRSALASGSKRKKTTSGPLAFRPPQKMFNYKEIERLDRTKSLQMKKGGYFTWGNDTFKDGYLEKDMKIVGLIVENVSPTLDEITRFAPGGDSADPDDRSGIDLSSLASSSLSSSALPAQFQPGDTVEVTEGDLIHTSGVVDSVDNGIVTIIPRVEGLTGKHKFHPKQLRKRFRPGDHVKVINGKFKDETGMVLKLEENMVTMLSDLTLKEVTVFSKDVREAAEVTLGQTMIGNYELHDLVQLDFSTVGVIVKVDRESFRVLDNNGELRTVQPHQISHKRDSKKAVATDNVGNTVQVGDTVQEIDGDQRKATVLHLYRQQAFLQSREVVKDFGVWVVRTRGISSVAGKGGRALNLPSFDTMNPDRGGSNPASNPYANNSNGFGRGGFEGGRGRGGERGRGGNRSGYGRGRGGRDNLISATVRISKGPHKGYVGIVKDTTDTMARVELHTNFRILTVDKAKLTLLNARGEEIGPVVDGYGNAGNSYGGGRGGGAYGSSGNNAYNPSAPSPRRYNDGNMTPVHSSSSGSRTPAYTSGSRTPAWNAGSRTPNPHAYADGSRTPAWDVGSKTPNPHAYGSEGSKTPAWDSGSRTPRTHAGGGSTDEAWNVGTHTPARQGGTWEAMNKSAGTSWSGEGWKEKEGWGTDKSDDGWVRPSGSARFDPATPARGAPTPGSTTSFAAPSPAPYPSTPAPFPSTPAPHTLAAPTPYDSAPTPAASSLVPATPAPNAAPTPAPHLLGAHAVAPTPGPMSAPTPGPLSAPTPGHFPPSTPGAHFPQTPFMPNSREYHYVVEEKANEVEDWPMHDIEVKIVRHRRTVTSYSGGAYDGRSAQVLRVDTSRRTCKVQLLGPPHSVLDNIAWDYLEPVRPGKKENLKVIAGELRGQLGQLYGEDNHDAIVKLNGSAEFKIMAMSALARYVGDEEV